MMHTIHSLTTRRTSLHWLLVLTFLSMLLFPLHVHLHHAEDTAPPHSGQSTHEVDFHTDLATDDADHLNAGHIVKSVADTPYKNQTFKLFGFLIPSIGLLFLALHVGTGRPLPLPVPHRLPRCNCHALPPLRAPPRG